MVVCILTCTQILFSVSGWGSDEQSIFCIWANWLIKSLLLLTIKFNSASPLIISGAPGAGGKVSCKFACKFPAAWFPLATSVISFS